MTNELLINTNKCATFLHITSTAQIKRDCCCMTTSRMNCTYLPDKKQRNNAKQAQCTMLAFSSCTNTHRCPYQRWNPSVQQLAQCEQQLAQCEQTKRTHFDLCVCSSPLVKWCSTVRRSSSPALFPPPPLPLLPPPGVDGVSLFLGVRASSLIGVIAVERLRGMCSSRYEKSWLVCIAWCSITKCQNSHKVFGIEVTSAFGIVVSVTVVE